MPTYRNDSAVAYPVPDRSGRVQLVEPGKVIKTFKQLDLEGMVKISESPVFNPVPSDGVHEITSIGVGDDKTVSLDLDTEEIEIWNGSSADITCFLQTASNAPGLKIPAGSVRNIVNLKERISQVVLQFSAKVSARECYLTELKG